MRLRRIKRRQEKQQREEHLRILSNKHLELFSAWHDMLYPVKKTITITGTNLDEVSQKAANAMAPLYELRSYDKHDARYPGEIKRLHSLENAPVLEINQFNEGSVVKVIATLSYTQYALKPGFTEEAFYAAAEAGDQAAEEYMRYRKVCLDFGMKDV